MKKQDKVKQINVIARAPFKLYFQGTALSLSATNAIGKFDVLPGHADFFSMLEPGEVYIEPVEGEPVVFNVSNGIVTVRSDEVMLFANM